MNDHGLRNAYPPVGGGDRRDRVAQPQDVRRYWVTCHAIGEISLQVDAEDKHAAIEEAERKLQELEIADGLDLSGWTVDCDC